MLFKKNSWILIAFFFTWMNGFTATNSIVPFNDNNTNIISNDLILSNQSTTNFTDTNARPAFPDLTINPLNADPSKNIIFDSYDEVLIQNYEKNKITHIKFLGNVKIRFSDNTLKARMVIVTVSSNKVIDISAFEKVEFRYGGSIYLSDFLSFNPETKQGVMNNVRSYTGGGAGNIGPMGAGNGWYYKARKATILSEDRGILEDAYFTYTPVEYPHYQIFSQKMWYFKNDMIFALNDTYIVGGANFMYLPFFFRWERMTGIRTAFGIEKRIGWYLMNSVDISSDYGLYNVGLDIYERLGQYMQVNFRNGKKIGPFSTLNIFTEAANDTRIFYDSANDRYSQIVNINGVNTNIQQLSWHYKINAGIVTNNTSLNFNWEDLNDPFFSTKYQQRRYVFDIKDVIQPLNNQFYTHNDGTTFGTPQYSVDTIGRGFSISSDTLSINGNWNYTRKDNYNTSNAFLNERYSYVINSISFPNIKYTMPTIDVFNFNNSVPVNITLKLPDTNRTLELDEDPAIYLNEYDAKTSQSSIPNSASNSSYSIPAGVSTNKNLPSQPVSSPVQKTVYSITTNKLSLYSFTSFVNADFNYNSLELYDTNQQPYSDSYEHDETGSYNINGAFINNYLNWGNSLGFLNRKRWSSFTPGFTNNMLYSGAELNYRSSLSINQTAKVINTKDWGFDVPYSAAESLDYQLYRTTRVIPDRYYNISTDLGTGFKLNRNFNEYWFNFIDYSISANYNTKYRITNDVNDDYIDNMIERYIGGSTTMKVIWLSASTGIKLDILETKSRKLILNYQDFTNRIVPGYSPMLTVSFQPDDRFNPLPKFSYVYDIIKQTNVNYSIISTYSIKNLYGMGFDKIEALNFSSSLFWDFLSPRNTVFNFSIGTIIWFDPYWRFNFSTAIQNNKIYRYFYENAARFNEPYVEFWHNLEDGINIFNYDGLKRSFFKLQNFHFDLVHNLNEWEMHIMFDVTRKVDNIRMISYWEPDLKIEFNLAGTEDKFPPYEKKFVPDIFQ